MQPGRLDGTNAAYWKETPQTYWRSSDAARSRMSVLWDKLAFTMTLSPDASGRF